MEWENWKFPGCENFTWMQLLNFLREGFILIERDGWFYSMCSSVAYSCLEGKWVGSSFNFGPKSCCVLAYLMISMNSDQDRQYFYTEVWGMKCFFLFILFIIFWIEWLLDHQSLEAQHKTCLCCLKKKKKTENT